MDQPQETQIFEVPAPSETVSKRNRRTRKLWLIWSLITVCVIALVVVFVIMLRNVSDSSSEDATIVKESQTRHETYSPMKVSKDPSQLTYGKWTGELKYGQPHGNGTLTYSRRRLISQFDADATVAEPGDYVIGEFDSGQLVNGRLYRKNGKVVEISITLPQ